MTRRRKVRILIAAALAVVISGGLVALPEVVRRVAIREIAASTGRAVVIKDVDLNLFTGRLVVKAFALADRGRSDPFVWFDQLNGRVRLLPLFAGRVRIAELSLRAPTVRVVRTGPAEFNFSDLLPPAGAEKAPKGAGVDISIDRFALAGGSIIVEDMAITPGRTWKVEGLAVQVSDLSTRAGGPGGTASVAFKLAGTPISLQASHLRLVPKNGRATLAVEGFDLALLLPYLPPQAPATLQSGRLSVALTLEHDAAAGTRAGGDIRLENLVVLRRGQTTPFVSTPSLRASIKNINARSGGLTAGRIELAGDLTVVDANHSPAPRFDLNKFVVAVQDAAWPMTGPARVQVTAGLPGGGGLEAEGTIRMAPPGANLSVILKGADLAPYQSYVPIAVPLAGKADANLTVVASMDGKEPLATVRGKAGVSRLALGPRNSPMMAVERLEASGLDIRWPSRIAVERIVIRKPSARIERDRNGRLPLRELFVRTSAAPAGARPPVPRTAVEVGETVIEDGYAQFIDRTGSPPFTEELSRLAVSIKGLTNTTGKSGRLVVQGVIGAASSIEMRGEISPLGDTLFLDLDGELRDFAVPRINSYMNRILAWIARAGQLSTKIHFRINGDELEAKSEIVVNRLDVVQAGENDEAKRRIGLPLGLIVALLKDLRGEIRVAVPVSGSLSAPEFSLGEAIWTAARNAIVNILAAPFKLIGRLFTKDGKVEGITIDPVRFEPGSGILNPATEQQLRSVADFLRNSPFIRLNLSAVVSAADMASLKTKEVTARIQRLQREQRLTDLATAAARLFRRRFPDRAMPKSVEDAVTALREIEPAPQEAGHALARQRLEITREGLIKTGGIEGNRLQPGEAAAPFGAEGGGRVEFSIIP